MAAEIPPLHEDLVFLSPLSQARADVLVAGLADGLSGTVLDLGCGWGELLLQVVAAAPAARGHGIDTDEAALGHGRALAAERGLADRVTFEAGDARGPHGVVDAAICVGASQIWGPPVEDRRPLDYDAALGALRALLPRGGRLLYGEAIWSRPPTPEAVAPLSGRQDEFVPLARLLALADHHGFVPLGVHEATLDEWDAFESGFCAGWSRWLAAHDPDHPEAAGIRGRAAAQRAAYHEGYRGVLGMAYLQLLAV